MNPYFALICVASAVWVGIDASNLNVRRGVRGGGFLDMGVAAWVVATLLLWIVAFPCYLCARPRYVDLNRRGGYVPYVPQPAAAASYGAVAPQPWQPMQAAPMQAVPVAPPQLSADGYWWWTCSEWVPAHQR